MKIAIIGSGPGGLAAALKAIELKADVTVIEKGELGGICLNEGCIPTKKLLDSAKNHKTSWRYAFNKKGAVVENIREDLQRSLVMSKIKVISGQAEFVNPHTMKINSDDSEPQMLEADKIIIAAGSSPIKLGGLDYSQPGIMTSTEALNLKRVPKSIVIIGGGVIGLEFATIFHSFGTKVTILEMTETLLPGEDKRIADAIGFAIKKQGMEILTKTTCKEVLSYHRRCQKLLLSNGAIIEAEKILVAVGRIANSKNLGLEKIGIQTDQKGFILVDEKMETNIPGVYAVGDITGKFFLAHVASREGEVAAENAMDKSSQIDYSVIPRCVYTSPEIASVGLNAKDAEKLGFEVKIARANFSNNSLARIKEHTFGFCQLVMGAKSQKILGAQIIGENATELIHEIAIAIQAQMTADDLKKTIFAHPTFSEIIKETARR